MENITEKNVFEAMLERAEKKAEAEKLIRSAEKLGIELPKEDIERLERIINKKNVGFFELFHNFPYIIYVK